MGNGQLFILGIIIVVMAGRIVRDYLRLKETRPRESPHYQAHIDALEHRVQTLERIVTDQGYDLKRKFDTL
jgi:hypothetical protein